MSKIKDNFNWKSATKKEIFDHKYLQYNAKDKQDKVRSVVNNIIDVDDYIDEENDIYVPGGMLYTISRDGSKDQLSFISNHLTMKGNLDILVFDDIKIRDSEYTQKDVLLFKIKSVINVDELDLDNSIQNYGITPELTDDQQIQIATGQVSSSAYDTKISVVQYNFLGVDLLVHVIKDENKVYYIEELPDNVETKEDAKDANTQVEEL